MEALVLALFGTVALAAPILPTVDFELVTPLASNALFTKHKANEPAGDGHIVMLNPSSAGVPEILSQLNLSLANTGYVYDNNIFKGFSAPLDAQKLDKLRSVPGVVLVEEDIKFHTLTTRLNAPWGLQRISSSRTVSGPATALQYNYTYDGTVLGSGVDVYVLDTGIYTDHLAFNGRARIGFSAYADDGHDAVGHGTHVSGTAAGATVGAASNANIIGVKVLSDDGSGSSASVLAGLDYILQQHLARSTQPGFVASVLSASLGADTGSGKSSLSFSLPLSLPVRPPSHTLPLHHLRFPS